MKKNKILAIIGLGYVGLPLAVAFSKKFKVIGYDNNKYRIHELKKNIDKTGEVTKQQLKNSKKLTLTSDQKDISSANIYVITVPTPVKNKKPDLRNLEDATKTVAKYLKKNDFVIYESTVYPGVTESLSKKILEKKTNLNLNKDFYIGYSPERINPSDKKNNLENIIKVVSGSNNYSKKIVTRLYSSIIKAGIHQAPSIKVAEAAKVIENAQRDLNIAFINELSIIFNNMNLSLKHILKASSTKWNFLNFKAGLVGGHCIGVDPYYLTHVSKQHGYIPKVILAGRKINNEMGQNIAKDFISKIFQSNFKSKRVLILGYTFKENCNDIRNTKVKDLFNSLKNKIKKIDIYDHLVIKSQINKKMSKFFINDIEYKKYHAIILAVPHKKFVKLGSEGLKKFLKKNGKIYDIKHVLEEGSSIYYL